MVYQPFHHLKFTTPPKIQLFCRPQSSSRPKSDSGYQTPWLQLQLYHLTVTNDAAEFEDRFGCYLEGLVTLTPNKRLRVAS